MESCFIDHRTTNPNRPQTDGATERVVQCVKRALKKLCEQEGCADTWDDQLPWIALGYNCSVQSSTRLAPYQLMYARTPTIPPAVVERMDAPLELANPDAAAANLLVRREALRQHCLAAGENLLIAQHRQQLWYARRRGGTYTPALRRLHVGDYVYLRMHNPGSTLQITARPEVLRVVELRPEGGVVLQGKCGKTVSTNVANCCPCHLPDIDPEIDVTLQRPDEWLPCEVCGTDDEPHKTLLCDNCGTGWHFYCLDPPVGRAPPGAWICPRCSKLGVDLAAVQARLDAQQAAEAAVFEGQLADAPAPGVLVFPTASSRRRDERDSAMEGRAVKRSLATGDLWGRVHYRGASARPYCFRITYHDGQLEDMSWKQLQHYLQPEGAVPPAVAALSLRVRPPALALPATWPLHTTEGMLAALSALMPGDWSRAHATRLSRCMPGQPAFLQREGQPRPGEPECVATSPDEVLPLLAHVDLRGQGTMLDPWCGTQGIASALRSQGLTVFTNDINPRHPADSHSDALQPAFYSALAAKGWADVVVTSPRFLLADLALPLAVHFARVAVCMHLPGHYLTDAHPARLHWLRRMHASGRLHVVMGLPKGPLGRRCVWLVVVASAALRKRLLAGAGQSALSL